jgi:hypothetical protein
VWCVVTVWSIRRDLMTAMLVADLPVVTWRPTSVGHRLVKVVDVARVAVCGPNGGVHLEPHAHIPCCRCRCRCCDDESRLLASVLIPRLGIKKVNVNFINLDTEIYYLLGIVDNVDIMRRELRAARKSRR